MFLCRLNGITYFLDLETRKVRVSKEAGIKNLPASVINMAKAYIRSLD